MNLFKRTAVIIVLLSIMGCGAYVDAKDSLENSLCEEETTYEIKETEVNIEETTVETLEDSYETVISTEYNTDDEILETTETFEIDYMNKVMYAKSYVNVRNYPGVAGAKVGALKLAQPVNVLGLTSSGWYLVEYNGEEAYISSNYLSEEEIKRESLSDKQLESIITFNEGVPYETQVAAYKYWGMIPETTRTMLLNDGWRIEVINSRYLDNYYSGASSVVGITFWKDHKILMGNAEKHMRRALNHEIGHAIDHMYNWPSEDKEWKDIWKEEMFNMEIQEKFDDHPIESETEFFAECVSQYIQYNDILLRTCPKAYNYISKYVY